MMLGGTTPRRADRRGRRGAGSLRLEDDPLAAARRRPDWTRRVLLIDIVVMLALNVATAIPLLHRGDTAPGVWLLDQAIVLPLALRRRYPIAVFAVVAVLASVQWLTGERLPADAALLLAFYTVAAHDSRRRATIAAAVLELGVILAALRFAPTGDGVIGSFVFLTGIVAAVYLLGTSLQSRRDHLASVEDRAVRLEIERDQQAQLSATAERTRIAREMHDIVAHNLSVMITLADGAAATNATQPAAAGAAMEQVATTGRQALGEMRHLLGVLRDTDQPAGLDPQPNLAQLDQLLDQVRNTGLTVRLQVQNAPHQLTPTAELTVYRVVQECLTNTLKHAHRATAATVILDWRLDALHLVVTDDGDTSVPARPSEPGLGLSGMRERLAVHGGLLTAGPTRAAGWKVHARLPVMRDGDVR